MKTRLTHLVQASILVWIVLIFQSCTPRLKPVQGGYFEGEVRYRVESVSLSPALPNEVVEDILGTEMIGIVREDRYKVMSIAPHRDTILIYYDMPGRKVYYDYPDRDTIFWYPLDQEPGELIAINRNEKPKEEVLGQMRESVTIRYSPDSPYVREIEGTYYFDETRRLNKTAYQYHKEAFWHLFVNETGSISIRNDIIAKPLYACLYEAYEVIDRAVSEEEVRLSITDKVVMQGEPEF